jgi:hypothetical protein
LVFKCENISPIKIYMGDYSTQEAIIKGKIKIKMIVGVNMILTTLMMSSMFFV